MSDKLNKSTAMGEPVDLEKVKYARPPVIFQAQFTGHVPLNTPAELNQWAADMKDYYGLSIDASGMAGIAAETCTGGGSDACDQLY